MEFKQEFQINGVKHECRYCGTFIGEGNPRDMSIHYKTPQHMINFLNFGKSQGKLNDTKLLMDIYLNGTKSENLESLSCDVCKMKFNSHKILENHLKTKKHIKNFKKYEKFEKQLKKDDKDDKNLNCEIKSSEHSSDYEDIEMDEIENNIDKCVLCNIKLNEENIIEHLINDHKYPIPQCLGNGIVNFKTISGLNLIDLFMKSVFDFYYKEKSCPRCFKSFLNLLHLKNHIKDTGHFYYSIEFNENKIIKDLEIVPKLHLSLKQIKQLEEIPVDYDAISQSLDKNISHKNLKQLVLHQLSKSKNAYILTDETSDLNKDKSFALRKKQKSSLHIGSQMNKVQRKIPKKLMFM